MLCYKLISQSINSFTQYLHSGWMRMAVTGAKILSIRPGKRSKVKEKSVKSQGILK